MICRKNLMFGVFLCNFDILLLIFKILLILILISENIIWEIFLGDVWCMIFCVYHIFERFHGGVWWCFVWILYLRYPLVKYDNLCAYHIRGGVWWCCVWMVELLCAAGLSVTVADQQMNGCAWSTIVQLNTHPTNPFSHCVSFLISIRCLITIFTTQSKQD